MANSVETIEALHTTLVDACRGYRKAVEQAEDTAMYEMALEALELHRAHEAELREVLQRSGRSIDVDGSLLGTVHVAAITLRSTIVGLDRKSLSVFIDGEERHLASYDESIAVLASQLDLVSILRRQRSAVVALISMMKKRMRPTVPIAAE
jgi:uncharacterized protein YabE (DUF348 family)